MSALATSLVKSRVSKTSCALADCIDCPWTYEFGGDESRSGEMALRQARQHAARHLHLVHMYRTTEYDGRQK